MPSPNRHAPSGVIRGSSPREESMLIYVSAYLAALVAFVVMDATWLATVGAKLYRSTLGDILLPAVFLPPAIAFYLLMPVGIVVFAVMPALRIGSATTA